MKIDDVAICKPAMAVVNKLRHESIGKDKIIEVVGKCCLDGTISNEQKLLLETEDNLQLLSQLTFGDMIDLVFEAFLKSEGRDPWK